MKFAAVLVGITNIYLNHHLYKKAKLTEVIFYTDTTQDYGNLLDLVLLHSKTTKVVVYVISEIAAPNLLIWHSRLPPYLATSS